MPPIGTPATLVGGQIETPLGAMHIVVSDEGICLLEFIEQRMHDTRYERIEELFGMPIHTGDSPWFEIVRRQMGEYFDGVRTSFDLPLVLRGTPFQRRAWQALLQIPYGTACSYQEQAKMLDNPKAIRAVGRANGANRIGIVVPCHRVIASNGTLSGYGGGIWRKRYLLDLERGANPALPMTPDDETIIHRVSDHPPANDA